MLTAAGSGLCGNNPLPVVPLDGPLPACPFVCTKQDAACRALGDFYHATTGQSWRLRGGWEAAAAAIPTDYCSGFDALRCDGTGAVVELLLSSNQLSGFLPYSLGTLTSLTALSLADNGLLGSLPPSVRSLSKLKLLLLAGSGLCGDVPMSRQPDDGPLGNCDTSEPAPPMPPPPPAVTLDMCHELAGEGDSTLALVLVIVLSLLAGGAAVGGGVYAMHRRRRRFDRW